MLQGKKVLQQRMCKLQDAKRVVLSGEWNLMLFCERLSKPRLFLKH